jgi:hypothetical protein
MMLLLQGGLNIPADTESNFFLFYLKYVQYRVTGYLLSHAQGGKLKFLRGMEVEKQSLGTNRHWNFVVH